MFLSLKIKGYESNLWENPVDIYSSKLTTETLEQGVKYV